MTTTGSNGTLTELKKYVQNAREHAAREKVKASDEYEYWMLRGYEAAMSAVSDLINIEEAICSE